MATETTTETQAERLLRSLAADGYGEPDGEACDIGREAIALWREYFNKPLTQGCTTASHKARELLTRAQG